MSKKQHVSEAIRNAIVGGDYPDGRPLPGELELAGGYGVSRHTVRAALDQLKKDGVIYTKHGVGSFPRQGREEPRYTQAFSSTDDLLMHTEDTDVEIFDRRELVVDEKSDMGKIGLRTGERWIAVTVERSSKANLQPISRATVYARPIYFEEMDRFIQGQHPLFKLIECKSGPTLEIEQRITARAACASEAGYFSIRKNSPILEITRIYHDRDRRPYEITVTAYNSLTFSYVSTITPAR